MRLRPTYATGSEQALPRPKRSIDPYPGRSHRTFVENWLRNSVGALRDELQRATPEDVVLGDLDGLQPEGAEDLDQDHHAGDDRRRAVGMQARDRAPLRVGHLREAGEQLVETR